MYNNQFKNSPVMAISWRLQKEAGYQMNNSLAANTSLVSNNSLMSTISLSSNNFLRSACHLLCTAIASAWTNQFYMLSLQFPIRISSQPIPTVLLWKFLYSSNMTTVRWLTYIYRSACHCGLLFTTIVPAWTYQAYIFSLQGCNAITLWCFVLQFTVIPAIFIECICYIVTL